MTNTENCIMISLLTVTHASFPFFNCNCTESIDAALEYGKSFTIYKNIFESNQESINTPPSIFHLMF